jgi:hypothetical protein
MRRAPALLLTACLALGLAATTALVPIAGPAQAQSIVAGGQARVVARADRGVNVRSAPEVRTGNVVASASGGDVLRVIDSAERGGFTWYRVESLPEARAAFTGWIRGDLLTAVVEPDRPERTLPEVLADSANDTGDPAAEPDRPQRPPYPQRTDWSRDILRLFPAIEGCVRVNSAPPVTVLRAILRSRGLAEVIMSDSAGRRWDCVISSHGGTPIRYDPLSGAVFIRDRLATEPFFMAQAERPRLDANCHDLEGVVDPTSGLQLGWLYYRTCP